MTRNKVKAIGIFTSQEVDGKAPMTNLVSAPIQPKKIISLSTLGARKHTFIEARGSTFILKNSMTGANLPTLHQTLSQALLRSWVLP